MSINTKKVIKVQQLECNRCHYQWFPRISRDGQTLIPETCASPKCKSRYWNRERVLNLRKNKKYTIIIGENNKK